MTQPASKRLVSEARLSDVVAAAVAAPTDTAVAAAVNGSSTQTRTALDGRYPRRSDLDVNVKDPAYGAVGNGTADDTTAIGNAITAWMARLASGQPCTLLFPPGVYKVTHGFTLTPGGYLTGGAIVGRGAKITQAGTDPYLFSFDTSGTVFAWQRPAILGIHLDRGGIFMKAGASQFIWNALVQDVHVTRAPMCALRWSGVFESEIAHSHFELDPAVTPVDDTQCAILIDKAASAQPSSIGINDVTTRGGWRGIRSPNAADVRIRNVTVLAAQQEGIYLQGNGCVISDVHAETNSLAPGSSAAGVRLDGSGMIRSIRAISNTASSQAPYTGTTGQKFAAQVYVYDTTLSGSVVPGVVTVQDVSIQGNVTGQAALRCTGGQASSTLVVGGVPSRSLSGTAAIRVVTPEAGVLDTVAATSAASAALVANQHNPCDATSGALTMTLPTGLLPGSVLAVEKTDSTGNAVTVTGSIRGVGGSSLTLTLPRETRLLVADAAGSWWPTAGNLSLTSLDGRYAPLAAGGPTLIASGGESTFDSGIGNTFGTSSQRMQLSYFTALRTETCTQLVAYTSGTAAAATPTTCQMAIYSVDASDNLTLLASTANDTTLFSSANTRYARPTTSSFTKVAGQRYALAVLIVSATTTPSLFGRTGMGGTGLTFSTLPRRQGRIASQTALPATVTAATVGTDGNGVYMEAIP